MWDCKFNSDNGKTNPKTYSGSISGRKSQLITCFLGVYLSQAMILDKVTLHKNSWQSPQEIILFKNQNFQKSHHRKDTYYSKRRRR